ncbi:NACHT domain-containing protein [Actinomadura welshii]|uniref:NACHT domain-containing protein n=1 Tax=Actinomadura welshii TaxID=3103817 RepID=UPI0003ACE7B8|nr:hypothetical protein [Actinomadura madurae]
MADVFMLQVPRACRIRETHSTESAPPLAGIEAFRSDSDHVAFGYPQQDDETYARPEDLVESGALVVLGEPGAGKTSVLEQITARLVPIVDSWNGDEDSCLWVVGGDLTEGSFEDELGRHLRGLPEDNDSVSSSRTLTVVVDQLDESPLRARLPRLLTRSLRGKDTRHLRFLVACRTADYQQEMTEALSAVSGKCWCVDLAPLSREEAIALADSAGVPGEQLITDAEAAGAVALASMPLTLELLVVIYQADGRLQGTPEQVFATGVERLAEDPDPRRLQRFSVTTIEQRLVLAGRIAAWSLLSGHRNVWQGPAFKAGKFDLPGDVLAGGIEYTAAGAFDVTDQAIRETLATPIFTRPDGDRVAIRHSSVAAYLAARYLVGRKAGQQQLGNLFLVSDPSGGSASIPAPLRETAAWLVAMQPTATDWLAAADPESLAVHSALIRSDDFRRLTVSRLLERAAEVELGEARLQITQWDLDHPQMADQLAEFIEGVSNDDPANWESVARMRLVIRLSEMASTAHPRLAEALLQVADDEGWNQRERARAAEAAFGCDPNRTVPVLIQILTGLTADNDTQVKFDLDLRGTVLALLWPEHLDLDTVLTSLRPPASHRYDAYVHFLSTMPGRCSDDQLPQLLTWVLEAMSAENPAGEGFVFSPERSEHTMIDALIQSVLLSREPLPHLPAVAKVVLTFIREHEKVQLPDCLQPDDLGNESAKVQDLRRDLAAAVIEEAARTAHRLRVDVWQIAHGWQPSSRFRLPQSLSAKHTIRQDLLDETDFLWVYEQASRALISENEGLVTAYGELSRMLFPREDPGIWAQAYDEAHPAWPYLKDFFDPIPIDGSLAEALRQNHSREPHTWPQAAEFHATQLQLLAESRAGDNTSLWILLRNFRIDPRTGQTVDVSGPMASWPGAVSLGDLSDLPDLGLRYLAAEDDHADEWIDRDARDKRSWAGYAFLSELHDLGRLSEFPPAKLESWCGAILVEFLGLSTSFMEATRKNLLHIAAVHAPQALALRVGQLVPATLGLGRQPIVLNALGPTLVPALREVMEHLLRTLSAHLGIVPGVDGATPWEIPRDDEAQAAVVRTWHNLLGLLLAAASEVTSSFVDAVVSSALVDQQYRVLAAQSLLVTDSATHWPRVRTLMMEDDEFGRRVTWACAETHVTALVQEGLNEADMADLYLSLSALFVPEDDPEPHYGVGWVTPDDQARKWRDDQLRELSRRGTAEAVRKLRNLAVRYPDRIAVAAALVAATRQYAIMNWTLARVEDVMQVLRDPSRRLIHSSAAFLDAVMDVLQTISEDLPPHGELLWDRTPGKRARKAGATGTDSETVPDVWRPKPEAALCAYLAHELNLRMAGDRITVNREVLVQPNDAYGAGDRTDILLEAFPSTRQGTDATPVKLVIEVKGSWNPDLITAQSDQLVDRYLPEVGADAGIYIVGWYPIGLWDAPDRRKSSARKHTFETLHAHLCSQATNLSQTRGAHIRAAVLNIPRPHKER